MHYITFRDKKYTVSTPTFWSVIIAAIMLGGIFLTWAVWVFYLMASMLAYYTGVPTLFCGILILLCLVTVTINEEDRSLFPKTVQEIIQTLLFVATVYFVYTVQEWGILGLAMLIGPIIVVKLPALIFQKYKPNQEK